MTSITNSVLNTVRALTHRYTNFVFYRLKITNISFVETGKKTRKTLSGVQEKRISFAFIYSKFQASGHLL